MPQKLPTVTVIGAGAVGFALSLALEEKGYRFLSVISKTGGNAIKLARSLKCKNASTHISDIPPATQVIIIAVPDRAIETVVSELARHRGLSWKRLLVFHTSGVYGADLLRPLARKGSAVASLHPIQTFPSSLPPAKLRTLTKGIYYGIDADREVIPRLEKIVRDLQGMALTIEGELKPLYHVACVFASNYLTVLLCVISELSRSLNLRASWPEVFGPLMTATIEHVIKTSGPAALTGPIVRRDRETLDLHLKGLLKYAPQFLPLYTIAGIEAARIAAANGTIPHEDLREVIGRFKKFIKTHPINKFTTE